MKRIIFFLSAILLFTDLNAQDRLTADPARAKIEWRGEKVLGEHKGTVNLASGWLTWQNNSITGGEFLIDMNSIKDAENNQKLEGHLRSDDFFSVGKYPVSRLVISQSTPFDKGTATISGSLTIRDITNPIEFRANMQKKDDGMWFFAKVIIDRAKYNIKYGSGSFFDNLGDKTIYDEFELKVSMPVRQ